MHAPDTGRPTPEPIAGMTWASFEVAAPDLAAAGRRMFDRDGTGEALLATVRGDAPPRIHPINLAIVRNPARRRAMVIRARRSASSSTSRTAGPSAGWAPPVPRPVVIGR